jgi:hypothetical protein
MDYLTQYYKNRSIQLQEQIYTLQRMLNEADAPGPTQFPSEWNPPLLAPADFQVPQELPTRIPKPKPPVYNPSEKTYKEWLRNHPEPSYDPQDLDDRYDAHERWERERHRAEQYYRDRQTEERTRQYYAEPGQGFYRGVHDFAREVIPDVFNPF